MVIAWIGYCLLISGLLALAAFASERALGHFRKPVRWGWFTAVVGSVAVPVVAFFAPGLLPGFGGSSAEPMVGLSDLTAVAAAPALPAEAAAAGGGFDAAAVSAVLGWGWLLLVAAMVGYLGRVYGRLRSEMRTWTPGRITGSPVMISDERGPAVVGIRRSVVVMPKWIPELEGRLLRLVFLHEREHQRAGDHRLFAAAVCALVLMPWNLLMWWQVSRLRLAIEFDCDRRVLKRGESPRDYADALITVGSRVSGPLLAAAAFAERKPAVERRLRRMTAPQARMRVIRTLGASGVAMLAVLFVLGCPGPENSLNAPGPPAATVTPPADAIEWEPAPMPSEEARSRADRPAFIAYDRPPVLQNLPEVTAAMQNAYSVELRDAGIGGRVELWLYVDESGDVQNMEVKTSSGTDVLDLAATEVAKTMRFEPASNRDQPTDVWVSQWVTFGVLDNGQEPAPMPTEEARSHPDPPAFIAYDRPPVLQNGPDVMGALKEAYPQDLKEAGVGGRVEMWLYIDESGVVRNHQVKESSGIDALDLAAADVVETMRFEPAKNRDELTDVWVSQWVRFEVLDNGQEPADPEAAASDGGTPVIVIDDSGETPLIVIDGVIQSEGASMSDLGALDIDHVEVVKGPQAVELYGERARNGVVEITTKAGAAETDSALEGKEPISSNPLYRLSQGEEPNAVDDGEGSSSFIVSGIVREDGSDHVVSTDYPLIIIDGLIQSDDFTLDDIHPDRLDIENVEILKGEQATEAYGERAEGGVIIITTKDGG
ncbi:TonB family protein [Candidatus Palauibacter sp.]|uniref:TonB family protein n=1 Tax=Candidatus Palauibacter sp. TaxID=3101350 RepID=UPI003B520A3E